MMKHKEEVEYILQHNLFNFPINGVSMDSIMENWASNKKRFIDLFDGNEFIRTKDKVTIVRSHDELAIIWNDFLSDLAIYRFYKTLIKADELIQFLQMQGQASFFENRVTTSWANEDMKEIPKGMKISKALKFFIMDKDVLHKIQSRYSMILQDVQLTGYLYASVHPLDYLSVSENSYNWHSCHALDGEYAAGNINYMTDKVTVVCYLAEEKKQEIPRFGEVEWNSKKWRAIVYIGEDNKLMLASKGYPFKSDYLTQQCLNLLQERFDGEWSKIEPIEDKNDAKSFCVDKKMTLHFNDVLLSSSHRGYYSHCDMDYQKIEVGEPFKCLCCGQFTAEVSDEYTCQNCSPYESCIECGEPLYDGEEYWFDGEPYCEYCYSENIMICSCCDLEAHVCSENVVWREDLEEYYCDDCYKDTIIDWESEEI